MKKLFILFVAVAAMSSCVEHTPRKNDTKKVRAKYLMFISGEHKLSISTTILEVDTIFRTGDTVNEGRSTYVIVK